MDGANDGPPLLALLLETVDDQTIFDMSGVDDPEAFRIELRKAWQELYHNAVYCWAGSFYPENNDLREPEIFGLRLCQRFDALSSCWLESFRDGMVRVAGREILPEKDDRAFLFYMIGVMDMSWRTWLAMWHGDLESAEFFRGGA